MNEVLLIWGKYASTAIHIVALFSAFAGTVLLCGSFENSDRKGIRVGTWILGVSLILLAALPWWPVWDALIELARRP